MTTNPPRLESIQSVETGYDPESFGLDWDTVWEYREKIFSSDEQIDSGRVEESDGSFLYAWRKKNDPTGNECGGYYYSLVPRAGAYGAMFTQAEEEVFSDNPEIIKKIKKCENIIDCGIGLGLANKVKHLLYAKFLKYNGKKYNHIGWDISGWLTEKLAQEYKKNDSIRPIGINSSRDNVASIEGYVNKAIIMFGGSIGSRSEYVNNKFLSSLNSGSHFRPCPFYCSFFPAPQGEEKEEKKKKIIAGYKTKEAETFVMKGLEALGLPMDSLTYEVDYKDGDEKTPDKIRVGARVLRDITLDVGRGKTMTKKAGEYIRAIPSRRYTDQQFTTMLSQANHKHIKIYGNEGMKVAESTIPRKKFSEKTLKRAKNIALTLAGSAGLLFGYHKITENIQYNKARDYAIEEFAYKKYLPPPAQGEISGDDDTAPFPEGPANRVDFITKTVYDMLLTEYSEYDFPDEKTIKEMIMRYLPEYSDYFAHSQLPDKYFFTFVHHVLMPHIIASFGEKEGSTLYEWRKDKKIQSLIKKTYSYRGSFAVQTYGDNMNLNGDGLSGFIENALPYYKMAKLGSMYGPDTSGVYQKLYLVEVTMLEKYNIIQGRAVGIGFKDKEKFLLIGNDQLGYSLDQTKKYVNFLDEKGYASLLTEKIVSSCDLADPALAKEIHKHLISLHKQGYDFSWLCRGEKSSELRKFYSQFLVFSDPTLTTLGPQKDNTSPDIEKNSLLEVDGMIDFLQTYYGHPVGDLNQNVFPQQKDDMKARNFLLKIVLSGFLESHHFSFYPEVTGKKLYEARKIMLSLSSKLERCGYTLWPTGTAMLGGLEMLYDDYPKLMSDKNGFKELETSGSIGLGPTDVYQLYIGCILFTTDGRAWIVTGGNRYPQACELKKDMTYAGINKKLPQLFEQQAQELFSCGYDQLPAINQQNVRNRTYHILSQTVFHKTLDAAYYIAKDIHDNHDKKTKNKLDQPVAKL